MLFAGDAIAKWQRKQNEKAKMKKMCKITVIIPIRNMIQSNHIWNIWNDSIKIDPSIVRPIVNSCLCTMWRNSRILTMVSVYYRFFFCIQCIHCFSHLDFLFNYSIFSSFCLPSFLSFSLTAAVSIVNTCPKWN